MMRFLIPVVLALIGLGAGVGAGLFLRPAEPANGAIAAEGEAAESGTETAEGGDGAAAPAAEAEPAADAESTPEYVKLTNQFVVPVLDGGKVAAMVILTLSLEVEPGGSEEVYAKEPKLRDAFLQVMFDHANAGGFAGSFTDGANLVLLRRALKETGVSAIGKVLTDVLIVDIVRQDN